VKPLDNFQKGTVGVPVLEDLYGHISHEGHAIHDSHDVFLEEIITVDITNNVLIQRLRRIETTEYQS